MAEYSLLEQLRAEEGSKHCAYRDHLGYLTIGVGRLIDPERGGGLSDDEIDYLLLNDIKRVRDECLDRWPWIAALNEPRQAVVFGMAFQMGVAGLAGFKLTLGNIEAGRYTAAALGMLASKWAVQTPKRAKRISEQMRTGEWQFKEGFGLKRV